LRYIAPERLGAGAQEDTRGDIYSLACVLYECLTGRTPFAGETMAQLVAAHLNDPAPQPSIIRPSLPSQIDQVIATGMAKDPDQRYATTVELADAARKAITVSPSWRRRRVLVPALVAIVVLIGGGVFTGVKLSQHYKPTAAPQDPRAFTGTYRADFAPPSDLEGRPDAGGTATTEIWGFRSVCRPRCVTTAARRSGNTTRVSTLVFDNLGGRLLAVGLGSGTCKDAVAVVWQVFTLRPHPDGTLAGEYSSTASYDCASLQTVTFTRTADVDVTTLRDPAIQPPRVGSPAEALRGHYHETKTWARSENAADETDFTVRTECLRTGDQCISFFTAPNNVIPLLFAGGKWSMDSEWNGKCPNGDDHVKLSETYSLPQPSQEPITVLTGHGHQEQTGSCAASDDFDSKLVRTGD
jgi:Protein kinase domain